MASTKYYRIAKGIIWILALLFLSVCQGPYSRLYFAENGKEKDHLRWKSADMGMKSKLYGWVGFMNDGVFLLTVHIVISCKDTALFRWNEEKLVVLFDGIPMPPPNRKDDPLFLGGGKVEVASHRKASFDFSRVYPEPGLTPVSPRIDIVIDSAITWKGAPVISDTVHAYTKPLPKHALYTAPH